MQKQLRSKESQLSHAKTALRDQQRLMITARFTPEGYKLAEAKLHGLQAKVTKLTHQVNDLKHRMMVS